MKRLRFDIKPGGPPRNVKIIDDATRERIRKSMTAISRKFWRAKAREFLAKKQGS